MRLKFNVNLIMLRKGFVNHYWGSLYRVWKPLVKLIHPFGYIPTVSTVNRQGTWQDLAAPLIPGIALGSRSERFFTINFPTAACQFHLRRHPWQIPGLEYPVLWVVCCCYGLTSIRYYTRARNSSLLWSCKSP